MIKTLCDQVWTLQKAIGRICDTENSTLSLDKHRLPSKVHNCPIESRARSFSGKDNLRRYIINVARDRIERRLKEVSDPDYLCYNECQRHFERLSGWTRHQNWHQSWRESSSHLVD